jgi:hypothetical protein
VQAVALVPALVLWATAAGAAAPPPGPAVAGPNPVSLTLGAPDPPPCLLAVANAPSAVVWAASSWEKVRDYVVEFFRSRERLIQLGVVAACVGLYIMFRSKPDTW